MTFWDFADKHPDGIFTLAIVIVFALPVTIGVIAKIFSREDDHE